MSKRKYTHTQELLPEIQVMIANGKSHREIEEFLGLTGDRPVHNLLKRERRKEKKLQAGIAPRPKGRPRKNDAPRSIEKEQTYAIHRMKMENKLLRVFLQFTGSEAQGNVWGYIPPQRTVFCINHVSILLGVQKWLL